MQYSFKVVAREFLTITYRSLDWSRWTSLMACFILGLKSLGLFSMGDLKSLVYITSVENVEDFGNRIIAGSNSIRNTLFERVIINIKW